MAPSGLPNISQGNVIFLYEGLFDSWECASWDQLAQAMDLNVESARNLGMPEFAQTEEQSLLGYFYPDCISTFDLLLTTGTRYQ